MYHLMFASKKEVVEILDEVKNKKKTKKGKGAAIELKPLNQTQHIYSANFEELKFTKDNQFGHRLGDNVQIMEKSNEESSIISKHQTHPSLKGNEVIPTSVMDQIVNISINQEAARTRKASIQKEHTIDQQTVTDEQKTEVNHLSEGQMTNGLNSPEHRTRLNNRPKDAFAEETDNNDKMVEIDENAFNKDI